MNALWGALAPAHVLRRLGEFLKESNHQLSTADAAALAISQWIATERAQLCSGPPLPTRGYQWKSLFLPDGTELRIHAAGQNFYARVEGDAVIYNGHRVSPRQMALQVAGQGRNAWRDVWLLLPGNRLWRQAARLRREAEGTAPPQPVSPLEAMSAAANCMSETLKTALALVEHANDQALPVYERRIPRMRRANDGQAVLPDDPALD